MAMARIVMIDQDGELLDRTRERLAAAGFEVEAFARLSQTVGRALGSRPDLVVLGDLSLLPGEEIFRMLREIPDLRELHVVLISSPGMQPGADHGRLGRAEVERDPVAAIAALLEPADRASRTAQALSSSSGSA